MNSSIEIGPPTKYVWWNKYSSELGSLFKPHNEVG
jgi:hypothetical protein